MKPSANKARPRGPFALYTRMYSVFAGGEKYADLLEKTLDFRGGL
jgi:hypothetical protein